MELSQPPPRTPARHHPKPTRSDPPRSGPIRAGPVRNQPETQQSQRIKTVEGCQTRCQFNHRKSTNTKIQGPTSYPRSTTYMELHESPLKHGKVAHPNQDTCCRLRRDPSPIDAGRQMPATANTP
jgi:hypothetical protein